MLSEILPILNLSQHLPHTYLGIRVICKYSNIALIFCLCQNSLKSWPAGISLLLKNRAQRTFSLWKKQHAVKIIARTLQRDEGKNSLGASFT